MVVVWPADTRHKLQYHPLKKSGEGRTKGFFGQLVYKIPVSGHDMQVVPS